MTSSLRRRVAACAWIVLMCSSAASAQDRPPAVAGFERFSKEADADGARLGGLLIGELNCTACHAPRGQGADLVSAKQAPILSLVGSRVDPAFIREFIAAPAQVKPGTTMPGLFGPAPGAAEREEIQALTAFLASTGTIRKVPISMKAALAGEKLFRQVGCLACHDEPGAEGPPLPASVPLGKLSQKYSLVGLAVFLFNPHAVRPSGRMPAFNLDLNAATDLASYLLKDQGSETPPNIRWRYYEGSYEHVPDFETLKPIASGEVFGLEVGVAKRSDDIALCFDGFLQAERAGEYALYLGSDDGAKVWIDNREVVETDGVHPVLNRSGKVELKAGFHPLRVGWFNGGGESVLELDIEGPGIPRQSIAPFLAIKPEKPRPKNAREQPEIASSPDLIARGRTAFATRGCVQCHALKDDRGELVPAPTRSIALESLRPAREGCLSETPDPRLPNYHLSDPQRSAIIAALATFVRERPAPISAKERVAETLLRFNCYACHARDGIGGVEPRRDRFFETTQKEMGDEGRLPPHLNGVGAKLSSEWLGKILSEGAKDRPYMLTRMPSFGSKNVGLLSELLAAADPIDPVPAVAFDIPERRVKSAGRELVGAKAFGCGSCHSFRGRRASGIQAIDMTIMTRRLRRDWFHRYVTNPQAYRPGTRMPSAWPAEKSALPAILDGLSRTQIEAVWRYLGDAEKAAIPYGLERTPIPLVADKEAVIYRNFIAGAGARAIGVGYPQKINLAFDANELRYALLWHGDFMDASRHWNGRGEGFEPPLGDDVVSLPHGPDFALLDSPTSPWPREDTRAHPETYRFLGYRLAGAERTPTFRIKVGPYTVEDRPRAGADATGPRLERTIAVSTELPDERILYLRAASGAKIEPISGEKRAYKIDGELEIRLLCDSEPIVREAHGRRELLVPFRTPEPGKIQTVVETITW